MKSWRVGLVLALLLIGIFLYSSSPAFIANLIFQSGTTSQLNITSEESVSSWQGVFGNLTSTTTDTVVTTTGDAISGIGAYSACPTDQSGELYFWQSGILNHSLLIAGNISEVDSLLGLNATHPLSASNLFTQNSTFNVSGTLINTNSTTTLSSSGHTMGLLHETGLNLPVFVTEIDIDASLYNNQVGDFQLLLPFSSADPSFNITVDSTNGCGNFCGDSTCDSNESSSTCSADCPAIVCGDGICTNSSESCIACAVDCGFCPIPTPPRLESSVPVVLPEVEPISPIGVTPIAVDTPGPRQKTVTSGSREGELIIDPSEINIEIPQGETFYFQMRLRNTHASGWIFTLDVKGSADQFVFFDNTRLFVKGDDEAILPLGLSVARETDIGTYTGTLIFVDQNDRTRIQVPVTIKVVAGNAPFVFDIEPIERRVKRSDDATFKVTIQGVPDNVVTYSIELYDVVTKKGRVEKYFTEQVIDTKTSTVTLLIPEDALDIRYIIRGIATYTDENGITRTAQDSTYVLVYSEVYIYFLGIPIIGLLLLALGMSLGNIQRSIHVHTDTTAVFLFEDHMHAGSSLLSNLDPHSSHKNKVLLIESRKHILRRLERQQQTSNQTRAVILSIIAQRDLAKQLKSQKYDVHYYKSAHIAEAINEFVTDYHVKHLIVPEPKDEETKRILRDLAHSLPQIEFR